MEHHARLPARQPWRSAALIAAGVAAVELCILVVLGAVVFGKFFSGQVDKASDPMAIAQAAVARETGETATPDRTGQAGSAKPLLDRRETSVIVLNGNGVAGAAATMAERVHARHYTIAGTGNSPRALRRSLVMYRPGFEREAKRLARDFGIGRVSPLDGLRAPQLQGAHVALIIGAR